MNERHVVKTIKEKKNEGQCLCQAKEKIWEKQGVCLRE